MRSKLTLQSRNNRFSSVLDVVETVQQLEREIMLAVVEHPEFYELAQQVRQVLFIISQKEIERRLEQCDAYSSSS